MQPTMSDLHVNALLTNLSLMYNQEQSNFVADQVFPTIPVAKASDRYTVFSRADLNRDTMQKRAPATESAGGGYRVDTTPTYQCETWALHKDIDDQQRGNADFVFNLDEEATRFLTMQALISKERAWATAFFAASIWTTDWTGVAAAPSSVQVLQWNDGASTPIQDVRRLKTAIQLANGGFRPNIGVMSRLVFDQLVDHPDFVDRVKYGQTPGRPAKVALDAIAGLFELDKVLVMDAIYNSAGEGAGPNSGGTSINAAETNAFIASKGFMLAYTPSAPGLNTPGCGYNIAWTGYLGANAIGGRVGSFYIQQIKSQRVEIELAYTYKKVMSEMGGFIASVIA